MHRTALALRLRSLGSRAALASGLLVLLATSAPPSWAVRDEAKVPLPTLESGDRIHSVATVHLHLTTPRGTWPLRLSTNTWADTLAWFEGKNTTSGASRIRWEPSCARIDCTQPRSPHENYVGNLETVCEERVTDCVMPTIEVRCESAKCTIDYDVALHIRPEFQHIGDVAVTAAFEGGIEPDAIGCAAKDSSTDSESAPGGLELSIKIGRFTGDPSDPAVVPDFAESPHPDYPTVMPDAGRDAGITDAHVTDANATDASLGDAQVTDAGANVPAATSRPQAPRASSVL